MTFRRCHGVCGIMGDEVQVHDGEWVILQRYWIFPPSMHRKEGSQGAHMCRRWKHFSPSPPSLATCLYIHFSAKVSVVEFSGRPREAGQHSVSSLCCVGLFFLSSAGDTPRCAEAAWGEKHLLLVIGNSCNLFTIMVFEKSWILQEAHVGTMMSTTGWRRHIKKHQ